MTSGSGAAVAAPSPWIARFIGTVGADVIRARVSIEAVSVGDISKSPPMEAENRLRSGLKNFYVPSEAELRLLVSWVDLAHTYSRTAYPSLAQYMGQLHAREITGGQYPAICLASLAGEGKSCLLEALARALPGDADVQLPSDLVHPTPMRAAQLIRVQASSTLRELIEPLLPPDMRQRVNPKGELENAESGIRTPPAGLARRASRTCFKEGVAAVLLDETQFASHSPQASAKATGWLLTFQQLPPPTVYAVNYVLLQRLYDRADYDKDRILSDVNVLVPDPPQSKDMVNHLSACQAVVQELIGFKLADESDLIFQLTANVKRKVRELLVLSYLLARSAGAKLITKDHLLSAYKSDRYKGMREDVIAIFTQSVTGKPVPKYSALWCPVDPRFNILPARSGSLAAASQKAGFSTFFLGQGLPRANRIKQENGSSGKKANPPKNETTVPQASGPKPSSPKVVSIRRGTQLDKASLLANTIESLKPEKS
jgi:hypothetical protein